MAPTTASITNLCLYVIFFFFCIHEVRIRRRRRVEILPSGGNIPIELLDEMDTFPTRILFATMLRIIWLSFELSGTWQNSFYGCRDKHLIVETIGRLGQLAFFSSFLGVLTVWWEMVRLDDALFPASANVDNGSDDTLPSPPSQQQQQQHRITSSIAIQTALERSTAHHGGLLAFADESAIFSKTSQSFLCSPFIIQVLLNFWIWVVALGLFIVKYEQCSHSTTISDVQTICIAIASGILGILFVIIGTKLFTKIGQRQIGNRKRLKRRIAGISVICFVSFGVLRCGLFLVRPLTGYYFTGIVKEIVYPWFFYTVPELVPSFMMLWFTRRNSSPPATEADTSMAREHVRMIATERTALLSGGNNGVYQV